MAGNVVFDSDLLDSLGIREAAMISLEQQDKTFPRAKNVRYGDHQGVRPARSLTALKTWLDGKSRTVTF